MIHAQIARSGPLYVTDDDRWKSLEHAVDLARQFPTEEAEVVQHLFRTITTEYSNAFQKRDLVKASRIHKIALDLIEDLPSMTYSQQGRIWCGDLVLKNMYEYIETDASLAPAERAIEVLSAAPYIALIDSLNQVNVRTEIFSRGQQAINSNDQSKLKRTIECLRLVNTILPVPEPDQLLELLQSNVDDGAT